MSVLRGRSILIAAAVMAAVFAGRAYAITAPPAGISIGNQASATYKDLSNASYTSVSNIVLTVVQQVASLSLAADRSKTISPGNSVYFPHTLTNIGNGPDIFSLSVGNVSGDDFDLSQPVIYPDRNGDGVPDSQTPITTTGTLPPDGIFNFVVMGTVASNASLNTTGQVKVDATSTFDGTQTATNTDSVTVTGNGVIRVTESISAHSGPSPSGPYTYTLTYTNTGNSTATSVKLTAVVPSDMTYVANSGRWSVTGTTALTDSNTDGVQGTSPQTIDYSVTGTTITAIVNTVAPGQSGMMTFNVNVNSNVPSKTIPHSSTFEYHDGASPVSAAPTNTVYFTVNQIAGVTVDDAPVVPTAKQGETILFNNPVTHTGNGIDSFDMTLGTSTFPVGTVFQLFKADGMTPLIDTNGNGIPDTGLLDPNGAATTTVVVKAILPPDATVGGPYTVVLTGTSMFDPTVSDSATDTLTAIQTNAVDLTNTAIATQAGATGVGVGPETASQLTQTVAPGGTTRFSLFAENTGGVPDTYDLAVSLDSSFASRTLPAGWTVVFKDPQGAVITNTGVISAGGNKNFFADVTVSPVAQATTTDLYFQVLSPTSKKGDILHDAVTVALVRKITLAPDQSGQVFPGGVVIYNGTLYNNGNGAEPGIALTTAESQAGWNTVLYEDTNGDGVLDSGDAVILGPVSLTAAGTPGATKTILIKVIAPAGAPIGETDTTTLSATGTGVSAVLKTVTTVVAGKIVLEIKQARDIACDGTPDEAYTRATLTASQGMKPGVCIRYEVTATNVGSADVINAVISAGVPEYTRYFSPPVAAVTAGSVTSEPVNGAMGTVKATVPTMTPGQSVVLTFGVKINQ